MDRVSTSTVMALEDRGMVSTSSLAPLIEAALSAAPNGLSEDLLVHMAGCADENYIALPKFIYSSPESTSSTRRKTVSALRKIKAKKRGDRWIAGRKYKQPEVNTDDAPVARVVELAPRRRCVGCTAYLRRENPGEYCGPCDKRSNEDFKRRVAEREALALPRPRKRGKTRTPQWSDEQLLDLLRAQGGPTTRDGWDTLGTGVSSRLIVRRFGTWTEALATAGFDTHRKIATASGRWDQVRVLMPATIGQVAEVLGISRTAAKDTLARMERRGLIVRRKITSPTNPRARESEYRLPDDDRESLIKRSPE